MSLCCGGWLMDFLLLLVWFIGCFYHGGLGYSWVACQQLLLAWFISFMLLLSIVDDPEVTGLCFEWDFVYGFCCLRVVAAALCFDFMDGCFDAMDGGVYQS
ncbi:hypothetical protein KFK09_009771 [Dendrobium nobile]|uniref:Uncharacterized protein n=1 Tax=Dendrobium nobile TaxID=94219 RepID=A0A8T3BKF8_DENNO|nr:hypothetical protein KFK09_009771 [Dendrobium nobile]